MNALEILSEAGYKVPRDYIFPYFVTWDFEAMLTPLDQVAPSAIDKIPHNTASTRYTSQHVPVSVAVHSNVPSFDKPVCFVSEGNAQDLIDRFASYLREIADQSFELLRNSEEFRSLYEQLEYDISQGKLAAQAGESMDSAEPNPKFLRSVLDRYLKVIPCVGFNSAKYDLNLGKAELFTNLTTVVEELEADSVSEGEQTGVAKKGRKRKLSKKAQSKSEPQSKRPKVSFQKTKHRPSTSAGVVGSDRTHPNNHNSDSEDEFQRSRSNFRLPSGIRRASRVALSASPSREGRNTREIKYKREGTVPIQNPFVIKVNNTFKLISTAKLRFLDVKFYLAPGYSYSAYLKAYGIEESKGHFCYEWLTDLDKLKETSLPPKEAFFNSLKNSRISDEDYAVCQEAWKSNNMKTMRDFLVWYNVKDVGPFAEALQKQIDFYKTMGLDMLKDAVGIPGLCTKYLFKNVESKLYFSLFNSSHSDLHKLIKSNIVGGPSIIFSRLLEQGITKIRGGPNTVQSVLGYDANALYLWAMQQNMPTQTPIRRRKQNNFRKELVGATDVQAREWLTYHIHKTGSTAQGMKHQFNGPEKRLGFRQIPVDGWDARNKTVYQYHGCYWHGHTCSATRFQTFNATKQKSFQDLAEETRDITSYLKNTLNLTVISIRECQWLEMRKRPDIQKILAEHCPQTKSAFSYHDEKKGITVESVATAVKNGKLFGLVRCDISVPQGLREYFSEFQPIFKNVDVSFEDLSPHMQAYCRRHDLMKRPRRTLISSYWASDVLLTTPLLRWYLKHGLVLSNVTELVEYYPQACFKSFGDTVSHFRRAADGDGTTENKIIGDLWKLNGNSSYGRSITNKEKFKEVHYVANDRVKDYVNEVRFKGLKQLSPDMVEIEMGSKLIVHDLPNIVGFFVYNYAKLKMLQFYYDCLDKYVDRRDFVFSECDTDSLYFGCSAESLEDVIKPLLREDFFNNYSKWFPAMACEQHSQEWIDMKCGLQSARGSDGQTPSCCKARQLFDKRTPGLFKLEFKGREMISLCSKTYYISGEEGDKKSSKGLQQHANVLTAEIYKEVLEEQEARGGENRGIKTTGQRIFTYMQSRKSLSYLYLKRPVLEDGITTGPTLL